ncbi:DUF2231 domain-containing protein [Magnetococcales bacterium HHB-1]
MESLFSGINILVVLHPMVVHFPIAYLVAALLSELIAVVFKQEKFHRYTQWILLLTAVSAIVAVGAGFLAAETLGHDAPGHDLVHDHRDIMIAMTVGITVVTAILFLFRPFQEGSLRKLILPGLVVLVGIMALGAHKGGALVYKYGTGVDPKVFMPQNTHTNHHGQSTMHNNHGSDNHHGSSHDSNNYHGSSGHHGSSHSHDAHQH